MCYPVMRLKVCRLFRFATGQVDVSISLLPCSAKTSIHLCFRFKLDRSVQSVWLFFCCYVLLERLIARRHLMCRSVLQKNENFHFIHVSFFNIWHLTTLQASEKFSQTSWIKSLWNNNHTVENLLSHLYRNCTVVGLELLLHLRYLDLIKMTSKPNMGIFFNLNELFWKCIK